MFGLWGVNGNNLTTGWGEKCEWFCFCGFRFEGSCLVPAEQWVSNAKLPAWGTEAGLGRPLLVLARSYNILGIVVTDLGGFSLFLLVTRTSWMRSLPSGVWIGFSTKENNIPNALISSSRSPYEAPSYRWRNWGLEMWSDLHGEQINDGAGVSPPACPRGILPGAPVASWGLFYFCLFLWLCHWSGKCQERQV